MSALWGRRRTEVIPLAWIVGAHGPDVAVEAVAEARSSGYAHLKLKVGLHGEDAGIATVSAVREAAPDAIVWVDANQAYTVDTAIRSTTGQLHCALVF